MSWIRTIFGASEEAPSQPDDLVDRPQIQSPDEREDALCSAFAEARERFWASVGTLDKDKIAYLISPELLGKPAWPTTRQAYQIVRTANGVIIASDGLTDPFPDGGAEDAGFMTEVYIETNALIGADFETIKKSWVFDLIENFAANLANMGGIDKQLERFQIMTIELPAPVSMPERWRTERGTVGALINAPAPDGRSHSMLLNDTISARAVPLTLLMPQEIDHVMASWNHNREPMARRLAEAGYGVSSNLDRMPLIKGGEGIP